MKQTTSKDIPAIVHQIWLGDREIPARFGPWMESVRNFAPGWEYRLWRDADLAGLLDEAMMPEILVDDQQNLGVRADIMRYEILRQKGGVYFDCDFEMLRPIDHLLVPGCLHYGDELSGRPAIGFLASPANFEFWGFLLRRIKRRMVNRPENWWDVVALTGPDAFAKALNIWVEEWNGDTIADEAAQPVAVHYPMADVVGFWREVLYPYWYEDHSFESFTVERYPLARAAHHWGGSWQ